MSPELDEKLVAKYPKIFVNRYADMRTTAMCWGFETGDGWYNIIDRMCNLVQHHIDEQNKRHKLLIESNPYNIPVPDLIEQVVAVQVKEKYGTLRFYYDGGDDYIRGVVSMAETMSGATCEECGNAGKMNKNGWLSVRCREHTAPEDLADYDSVKTD